MKKVKRGYRVLRGGSWYYSPRSCRSANRYWYYPVIRYYFFGFRVVCVPRALLEKRKIDEKS
jgi:formylglycine-generating enzyme required for sulfatase activity